MPGMSWSALLNSNTGPGSAYHTSTTLTAITPAPPFVLPANFVYSVGTAFTIKAFGVFSTTGTPNLTLGVYFGGTAGTALATTGAIATSSGVTNVPWRLEYDLIFRSNGATAAAMGSGFVKLGSSVSAYNDEVPIPNTALATVAVDTTAAKEIAIGATWGTSSASNTITLHGFKIWSDNL